MKKDFYEVLGLKKGASDAEIKSAYRKLARTHHPDIDKSEGAAKRFNEVSEAYQILSDPQKKAQYDQFGHSGPNPFSGGGNPFGGGGRSYSYSTSGFPGFEDPFDLFDQIFGGGMGNFRRTPTYQLEVSFDEVLHGASKTFEIKDQTGKLQRLNIKVPPGVDNGTRMRFGDIEIVFAVKRHPDFIREGADIFSDVELSIPQIVLGDVIEVKTVNGKVKLKVPNGTNPGSLIRIKDKGLPRLRGGKGDHYVRVNIDVPKKLSSDEKKLYEQLSNLKNKKSWF